MSEQEENNIIHIINNLRDEMKTNYNNLRDEMKTNYNTLRDEMKTNYNALRDEMKTVREEIKWLIGTIVIIAIAAVGGLGWIHNYHLKKENAMYERIMQNQMEIQKIKTLAKAKKK